MPDSYMLYPPDGASPVQLASWIELPRADPEFGGKGLLARNIVNNVQAPGGQLAYEQWGVRQMAFPLLIGSHSSFGGLQGAESLLRNAARPGGWIDIQPDGVPSAEAVRFDIITGRYEENYQLRLNQVDRRRGDLTLQTQPLGYWPTWIMLASTASVSLTDTLNFASQAVIGDAPGALRIFISPSQPTSYNFVGSQYWRPDAIMFSLGGRGDLTTNLFLDSGTFAASQAPKGLQNVFDTNSATAGGPTANDWVMMGRSSVIGASQAAFRGARWHAFAYVRLEASQGYPYSMALDLAYEGNPSVGMASWYGRIATIAPDIGGPSTPVAGASPAFTLLDFGEVYSPLSPSSASGMDYAGIRARLWYKGIGTGIFNARFDMGGIYLLRTDTAHGFLQAGLVQPSVFYASALPKDFHFDTSRRRVEVGGATTSGIRQLLNPIDVGHFYYGDLGLQSSATMSRLEMVAGGRRTGYMSGYVDEVLTQQPGTTGWLLYYYRLQDAATTVQFMAPFGGAGSYGPTGVYLPTGAGGPCATVAPGVMADNKLDPMDGGRYFDSASAVAVASNVYLPSQTSFSITWWAKRASPGASQNQTMIAHGTAGGSWRQFEVSIGGGAPFDDHLVQYGPNANSMTTTNLAGTTSDASYHHYMFVHNQAASYRALYRDGSLLASAQIASPYLGATATLWIGNNNTGARYAGWIDEVAVYPGLAMTQQAAQGQVAAGIASWEHAATSPVIHSGPNFASVQVEYQPRFQFLKGI